MTKSISYILFIVIGAFTVTNTSYGWHDRTHIAVAKAAGYDYWFNAAGADITKVKAGAREEKNHYFNNYINEAVTDKMVIDQAPRYDNPSDEEGHLYGAIISALRNYRMDKNAGKYAEYHMAFAAHYMGDLSQPLHNILYDQYNKTHHSTNDGIVDEGILDNLKDIEKNMYDIKIRRASYEEDLAKEVARIADLSRQLGLKLRAENRNMTKEEACVQLGHSASLLKSALRTLKILTSDAAAK